MRFNKRNFNNSKKDKPQKDEGMSVTVRNNDINGALRVLKKKLMKDGFFQELRERRYFVPKSVRVAFTTTAPVSG